MTSSLSPFSALNEEANTLFNSLQNSSNTDDESKINELLAKLLVFTRDKNLNKQTVNASNVLVLLKFAFLEHIDAQKCLNNIILNYPFARDAMIEPFCEMFATKFQNLMDDTTSNDLVIYYDLRLLFLLSALCVQRRADFSDKLSLLIFDFLLAMVDNYKKEYFRLVNETLKVCHNLTFEDCKDVATASSIIYKLLTLNFVVDNGNKLDSDDLLNKSDLQSFVDGKATTISLSDKLELVSNCVDFLNNMPENVYQDLPLPASDNILELLQIKLSDKVRLKEGSANLLSVINCCNNLCKYTEKTRSSWYRLILSSTTDFELRPEQYDTIRGNLCKLMTSVDTTIKDLSAQFLYTLCNENVDKFIAYTGAGNSASFLMNRGLFGKLINMSDKDDAEYKDDDDEAFRKIKYQLDPMTGMIERKTQNKELENMTAEEKEYHAHKLAEAISKLSKYGVIKPVRIDNDGNVKELDSNN